MDRKPWKMGFERFFEDMKPRYHIPAPHIEEIGVGEYRWMFEPQEETYKITCADRDDFERTKAMIEFCTEYENESFELFYKWFKQKDGKED